MTNDGVIITNETGRYIVEITTNFKARRITRKVWDRDAPKDEFRWPAKWATRLDERVLSHRS